MHLRAPGLSLVFDKAANFDVTRRLADDQRLVSRTLLRVKFSRKVKGSVDQGKADRATFPAWCERRGYTPLRGTQTLALVEIDTPRLREFEAAVDKAFSVKDLDIVDQWMAVHTEARPGRREKWTELADFLKPPAGP
jgi:hypothetical protein